MIYDACFGTCDRNSVESSIQVEHAITLSIWKVYACTKTIQRNTCYFQKFMSWRREREEEKKSFMQWWNLRLLVLVLFFIHKFWPKKEREFNPKQQWSAYVIIVLVAIMMQWFPLIQVFIFFVSSTDSCGKEGGCKEE